ncbi:hypothetical protein GCM10009630_46900 [Kribbella jejuensis]
MLNVALRELEGAPPLRQGAGELLALLDGQQRLTALLHALHDIGPEQYFVNFDALQGGVDVLEDDVVVSRRRGSRAISDKSALVPFSALRNDHTFFAWLATHARSSRTREWGEIFSERLQAADDYRIPVTYLGGELGLATVAQIFERTNKWGQRLDAFDLLVARVRGSGWGLRDAWEEAGNRYPAIGRVFGDNGLPTISAIALRSIGEVRRNAVLSLPPAHVEQHWLEAVEATASVAELLIGEGVRRPDLLAYDTVATAMIAARIDGASNSLLRHYYWLASMNRWHEVASNTRVVSDYRHISVGEVDPTMPIELPPVEELEANTRRSSRALWGAMVGAMLTAEPRDLVTSEVVSSALPEGEDTWALVSLIAGGAASETSADVPARLRTAAQVFVMPGIGSRLRRYGLMRVLREREAQPTLFENSLKDDLASQLLPVSTSALERQRPRDIIRERAARIRSLVERRIAF